MCVYLVCVGLPRARQQYVVYSAQFHVDLEAEIRESLRRCPRDILCLNALRHEAKQYVTDTLHLGYNMHSDIS